MKKLLLILGLSLGLASPASSLPYNLFKNLSEDKKSWFLGGIAEGILYSAAVNEAIGTPNTFYCMPRTGVTLGGDLAKIALQTYRNERGDDVEVGLGVLVGLSIMFPCN